MRLTLFFIPVCFSFFVCFLSPLVWFFLWLPEEVLALLFLLHRENGDFSILMKDIILLCGGSNWLCPDQEVTALLHRLSYYRPFIMFTVQELKFRQSKCRLLISNYGSAHFKYVFAFSHNCSLLPCLPAFNLNTLF